MISFQKIHVWIPPGVLTNNVDIKKRDVIIEMPRNVGPVIISHFNYCLSTVTLWTEKYHWITSTTTTHFLASFWNNMVYVTVPVRYIKIWYIVPYLTIYGTVQQHYDHILFFIILKRYSTVRYGAVRYIKIQYPTLYLTVRYGTIQQHNNNIFLHNFETTAETTKTAATV